MALYAQARRGLLRPTGSPSLRRFTWSLAGARALDHPHYVAHESFTVGRPKQEVQASAADVHWAALGGQLLLCGARTNERPVKAGTSLRQRMAYSWLFSWPPKS